MQRFFIADVDLKQQKSGLMPEEIAHQIVNVLRLKTGDRIILLDNTGYEFEAEVSVEGKRDVKYSVAEGVENHWEPEISVSLYQAVLKNQERFEWVLQKATELGVSQIFPLITKRCQVRELRKKARLGKIIMEAAEQSERGRLPELEEEASFSEMITNLTGNSPDTVNLFFYEGIREKMPELPALQKHVNVIIGPEGGFSEEEVKQIEECCKQNPNSYMLTLGKRILRSETASIAALSLILTPY